MNNTIESFNTTKGFYKVLKPKTFDSFLQDGIEINSKNLDSLEEIGIIEKPKYEGKYENDFDKIMGNPLSNIPKKDGQTL